MCDEAASVCNFASRVAAKLESAGIGIPDGINASLLSLCGAIPGRRLAPAGAAIAVEAGNSWVMAQPCTDVRQGLRLKARRVPIADNGGCFAYLVSLA